MASIISKTLLKYISVHQSSTRKAALKSLLLSTYQCAAILSREKSVYLLDEEETKNSKEEKHVNKYTNRSYTCGELRSKNIGERVTLCGWLEFQRLKKFLVLRDSYGETQVLIKDEDLEKQEIISETPFESIVQVRGTVLSRPKTMINKKQATGEIEVLADDLKILNKAKDKLPFNIREFQKANEPLRMQYRYLDLRFPLMQRNLRVRSDVIMKMRDFLINNKFVDVETPTLFKATPGGAQEFIVPTRHPGQFYSLVQSPQQFKQMLMAGAIDRYFQVARCYRDEGARPDRQPEFTQLDIEMSFTNVEGVIQLIEELLCYSWPEFLSPLPMRFQRIAYNDAVERYGSDKPDTRFEFQLKNCTDILKSNEELLSDNFGAYCLVFPTEYANLSKSVKTKFSELSLKYPQAKLVQSKINSIKEWKQKISRLIGSIEAEKLVTEQKLADESLLFLCYGNKNDVLPLIGKLRVEYADFLESMGLTIRKKAMQFLWVVDFPLFEISQETGELQCAHHPFTAPHPDDLHLLDSDPLKVRALAYDIVLNSNEIGGGSIRIHDPELQEKIFGILNIDKEPMKHILDMLGSGCPPHGGIALGLDRLFAVMLKMQSIRDVIAFPKTFEGRDPVSGAPSGISNKEKELYHIEVVDSKTQK